MKQVEVSEKDCEEPPDKLEEKNQILKGIIKKDSRYQETHEKKKKIELVPPDGGWGWAIVVGNAISKVIVIPIMQSFSLLYRDTFTELGMSATDISVIINLNCSFGMLLGLFHGTLLNRFGFRKVAVCGSLIMASGMALTSFANSFTMFLITYGIIMSMGNAVLNPSFQLALNTYFVKRRGKAMGFATTLMGIGSIFMPPLVSFLMNMYGVQGSALILSALALHSVIGAALLQPIKWHMKEKVIEDEEQAIIENDTQKVQDEIDKSPLNPFMKYVKKRRRSRALTMASSIDHDIDAQSIYGFDTPMVESSKYLEDRKRRASVSSYRRSVSKPEDAPALLSEEVPTVEQKINWWSQVSSRSNSVCDSSLKLSDFPPVKKDDKNDQEDWETKELNATRVDGEIQPQDGKNAENITAKNVIKDRPQKPQPYFESIMSLNKDEDTKRTNLFSRILKRIIAELDLNLLKDPKYLNLMIGMSLAITAEIDFSLMTPLFLGDLNFSYDETALLMSSIATADIIFRFITPFVADCLGYDARRMYIISLFMLIISRTTMIFFTSFKAIMAVSIGIGIARGVRTVYMALVIPGYVPIERLASASGLQMVTNGIVLLSFGPILGFVRDMTGTYNSCIALINMMTATTVTMWLTESFITWRRRRKEPTTEL